MLQKLCISDSHISKSFFTALINSLHFFAWLFWNTTSIFNGICLKPSQSRLLKLCGGGIHTFLIKGGWNVCVFFSFEERINPSRCDYEVPYYMVLWKNNVGTRFLSLWRLLHCESCGCYQQGRFLFPGWHYLISTFQVCPVAAVLQKLHWKWVQFSSCCRKQWAQVTNILLCTSHYFMFLCWTAQQWADLNFWFSGEMSVCS